MKHLLLAALLGAPCAAAALASTEKRVTSLEKRMTKVEKRVTVLETGGPAREAAKAEDRRPAEPIGATFLRKKQVVGQERAGIRLYVRFENLGGRRLLAFNGVLVFRDEDGSLIWSKPYGHSEPLAPGEKVEVSVGVLTNEPKPYLKFVRAKKITVTLEKQEAYGAE
ncbi:MAG: hypothetical protein M0025_07330 [Elusimicrobia bacterium]|nr:hypothetical protein [Elusimicrobiota bacterium]